MFSNLNIQSKIFAVFGIILLIGVIVVSANLYSIIHMAAGNQKLFNLAQKLKEDYRAQILLMRLELAEQGYWDEGNPSRLTEHTSYNAELDAFISKAILEASTPEERDRLDILKRTKQENQETFWEFVSAYDAGDEEEAYRLDELAYGQLEAMHDQIQSIIDQKSAIVAQIDDQQSFLEIAVLLTSLIAFVVFVFLAFIAAIMIAVQVNGPIILLTEAAQAMIAQKPAPQELAQLAHRTDEIGHLAQTFIRMSATVQRQEEELEQQAAELRAKVQGIQAS